MRENRSPKPSDIQALGEKLEQFRQGLPPGEQAALAWLIQRATMMQSDDSIAQGYAVLFGKKEGQAGGLPFQFETTWSLGDSTP